MLSIKTELLIIFLLLLANGVFAMAEIAMVAARKTKLKKLADKGDGRAQIALDLMEAPTRFLSTVQVGITLIGILAGAFGGATVAQKLAASLREFPLAAPHAEVLGIGTVVVGITLLSVVLGELIPKRLALHNPEGVALKMARPMRRLAQIGGPVVHLLSGSTDLMLRLVGIRERKERPVSDEEVTHLIELGLSTGSFQKVEQEMVEGVLNLDRLPVTALMTPRPKIVWLSIDDPDEVNWRKIVASGHSHFPVYQANRDQVLGMISVKALWAHQAIGLNTELKNLLVTPLTVPETLKAIQLLESFKKSGKHIALVVDEFGSIQGLVTLIDVLEAIVGDMPAVGDREAPEAHQREDGSWLIDATMPINEIKTLFNFTEMPDEQEADYQSLGGFVVTQMGRIPSAGDYFEWGGYRFEVVDMDRRRVDKVLVQKAASPAEEVGQRSAS